jgi:membrane-bound metal-dependent hydrolase YbcI (DUF457 family)
MFVFAHVFLGFLAGLGFRHLTNDQRALPLCILGAILSDILDKSLIFLFPDTLGSGRTIGHSLLFFAVAVAAGIILYQYRRILLGLIVACVIFSHQILDTMWTWPSTWFYPLMGPFPNVIIPDYFGHSFWLEITTPSEWVFAGASIIIIAEWYISTQEPPVTRLTTHRIKTARFIISVLLAVMGVFLFFFGLAAIPSAIFAPIDNPISNVMAGLLAMCGTVVLIKWKGSSFF